VTRRVASGAALFYLATLLAAPLVDRGRDVLRAYPEDYSAGPADVIVRLGYLAVALMSLAIAALVALEGGWPRKAAAAMLVAAAAVSLTLAVVPRQITGGPALVGVMLGYFLAPILLTLTGRRALPRAALVLGAAVGFGLVALAVAPRDVAGITNRGWDVLLALWGLAFSRAAQITSSRARSLR
jgi:hypothetical protein